MIPSIADIKKKANPGYKISGCTIDTGRALDYDDAFERLMESYSIYYNVTRHEDSPDFAAEAVFDSKGEQYFLIKAAKVAEMHTAEYVYFVREDTLTADRLRELDIKAWDTGTEHVEPSVNHKNTDVVLLIIAHKISDEAKSLIKDIKHSRTYMFALHGFSNYRLVAIETDTGIAYFNKQARILRSLIGNILVR